MARGRGRPAKRARGRGRPRKVNREPIRNNIFGNTLNLDTVTKTNFTTVYNEKFKRHQERLPAENKKLEQKIKHTLANPGCDRRVYRTLRNREIQNFEVTIYFRLLLFSFYILLIFC